jgi:alpha-glucosidase (family GH31 glycosyl hydrolase)
VIHPVEVTLCTSRIVRVRLGEAAPGATSYVGSRTWSEAAHCSAPGRVNTGEITVTVAEGYLEFGNRSGVMQLLLTLDETHIRPQRRVRLQTLGEQHFYGLGEGGQQFDRLGAVRRFWNFQSNRGLGADIAIPLLLSHLGYGLFFDSAAAATLQPGDAADGTWIEYHADAGPLDLYFIGGSSLRQVLGDVATLLGPATMPPRWALGYMQSSRHFTDAAEVRDLAAQFRTRRLPCDALIFLSSYGPAKGWNRGVGHLEFEPDLFANPEAILGEFGEEHFRIITHEYPVLHEASPLYAEAQANGYLLDAAYPRLLPQQPTAPVYKDGQRLIDFSKPEARSWWWRAHRPLADLGVAGWWLDGGEGPAGEVHNRYDLLRQQAFADGEALDRPDQRPFLLCRSGGPGMQRFGAAP